MALDGVSIEVRHGTLAALVGPDGAGKTTLIRLIAGLMPPDAGTLTVMGIDVAREPQQVQDRIAYMPQRFGLYEDLTVQENLDLYAGLHGVSEQERSAALSRAVADDGAGAVHAAAGRQALGRHEAEARACLHAGPLAGLLLLDEPTVGVDPLSRRELWDIIARLVREQKPHGAAEHILSRRGRALRRVFVLREGKLLASGPPGKA